MAELEMPKYDLKDVIISGTVKPTIKEVIVKYWDGSAVKYHMLNYFETSEVYGTGDFLMNKLTVIAYQKSDMEKGGE